jgi:signal transduction histidine kinase
MIGISRRQARLADLRNQVLLEQQQAAHVQETRASALAARQAAARDIHDVLAHSLGGLVIQLDAAEALLESGRTDDAHAKVSQARQLAADGLAEARRAVAALRAPDDTDASEQTPSDLAGATERLLRAHRELGGTIDAHIDLGATPQPLPAPLATAFERALQEALSNARRHAPGEPVAAELVAAGGRLELTVANPLGPEHPRSELGGGHGLTGMAERFAALDGGSATAGEVDGRFVVSASAPVPGH